MICVPVYQKNNHINKSRIQNFLLHISMKHHLYTQSNTILAINQYLGKQQSLWFQIKCQAITQFDMCTSLSKKTNREFRIFCYILV